MKSKEVPGKAKITMDEMGILTMEMMPKSDIKEDDAIEMCKAAAEVSGDVIHCNLIDIRKMTFMDKKARAVFASQKKSTVLAVAIISNSKIHRSLVNLYMGVSRPTIPTKAFDSSDKSREWVLEKLK
ncbi:MAG: hypothetical protein PF517_22580 [Salinivirgaceae bacterium]|jgi:hypothetical protein|nr:hypothetical protein [Salinivirgaceae bacterium]